MLLRRMNPKPAEGGAYCAGATTRGRPSRLHGFRSTFRDWAAERTNFPREIVEMALAHTVGRRWSVPTSGANCWRSGPSSWRRGAATATRRRRAGRWWRSGQRGHLALAHPDLRSDRSDRVGPPLGTSLFVGLSAALCPVRPTARRRSDHQVGPASPPRHILISGGAGGAGWGHPLPERQTSACRQGGEPLAPSTAFRHPFRNGPGEASMRWGLAASLVALLAAPALAREPAPGGTDAATVRRRPGSDRDSIAAYQTSGRPCACPYNSARNGSACGGRSAYSRPGGAAPLCYPQDVTGAMVAAWRAARR